MSPCLHVLNDNANMLMFNRYSFYYVHHFSLACLVDTSNIFLPEDNEK